MKCKESQLLRQKQQIIHRTAQIMREDRERDYSRALKKALTQLNLNAYRPLPTPAEIEQELRLQSNLFQPLSADTLASLYEAASQCMQLLSSLSPYLIAYSEDELLRVDAPITFHIYGEQPELAAMILMDRNIPYRIGEQKIVLSSTEKIRVPMLIFMADDIELEFLFLARRFWRELIRSPQSGRAIRRLNQRQLQKARAETKKAPERRLF